MAAKTWIKIAGVWTEVTHIWRNENGSWYNNQVLSWIKSGSVWRLCMEYPSGDPNEWHFETGGQTPPWPWGGVLESIEVDWSAGRIYIWDLWSNESFSNVQIYANVYSSQGLYLGTTGIFYNNSYSGYQNGAGVTISCSGNTGLGDMGSTGHSVVLHISFTW